MSYAPTVDTILHQASHLSTDEQLLLLERLAFMLRTHTMQPTIQKERRLGMYNGAMWMAEDFNAPLPDEFWLGEE